MVKIQKYIFLLLILLIFIFIFSSLGFSQTDNNLVELNIIGKNFYKSYYIKFSDINNQNSFKIYDI